MTRQEGAVKIALNRLSFTIAEDVNTLRERFLHVFPSGVVELTELGIPGAYLDDLSTSAFILAEKHRDKHSGRANFDATAEILLKRTVRQALKADVLALGENSVAQLAMTALAFCS